MDKKEILDKLKGLFGDVEEVKEDETHIFQYRTVDNEKCITLIINENKKENDAFLTHPDFERFINTLRGYKDKDFTYNVERLQKNKIKILKEISEKDREKIIKEMNDLYNRLLSANSKTLPIVCSMINDWVEDILKEINNN